MATGDALISLYRQMQAAMVAADSARLKALLTDDFMLVHITGYRQPREEWLADITTGRMRYSSSEEKALRVTDVDDVRATVIGRNLVTASIWGAQGVWLLQLRIDCVRTDGRWLMRRAVASVY